MCVSMVNYYYIVWVDFLLMNVANLHSLTGNQPKPIEY